MSLLDHYWTLASDNQKERINAAEALLSGLQEKESEEDWAYALKRLVRGLSSSKGSARLGFSMALAELLQLRAGVITVRQYLDLAREAFKVTGSMKGNEERGLLFGMLFALQILGKSSLWEQISTTSADLSAYVELITGLALKKAWLREPSFFALCDLVRRVSDEVRYHEGLEFAFTHVHDKGLSFSCEGVSLALSVSAPLRAEFNSSSGWVDGDPMNSQNISRLSLVLRETPVVAGDVSQSKPYVHFVWSDLLNEFIEGQPTAAKLPSKKKRKSGHPGRSSSSSSSAVSLAEFWEKAVDESFFTQKASSERKMWGFEIFLLWMQAPKLPSISPLFSHNLIKTWSLQLAQSDRNLHKIAKRCVAVALEILPTKPNDELIIIISKFMSASPNFDKLSKTKLVHSLLLSLDTEEEMGRLVDLMLDTMQNTPDDGVVKKQWILDNLVHLVRSANSKFGVSAWIGNIFNVLIPIAYFVSPNQAQNETESSQRLAQVAQERIMSILSSTLGKGSRGISLDPQSSWPYVVLKLILDFQKQHPEYESRLEFDDETSKAKLKAEQTLQKIHKKRNSSRHVDSSQLQAFELLFAMVLLQVYASVPDAVAMLDELQMCYNRAHGKRRALDEGEGSGSEDDNDDASMVLTEILVSLLAQQSTVLRKLSEDVWRSFSDQITESSLRLLCDILPTQEGSEGQKALFDVEDDEFADDDSDNAEDDDDDEEAIAADNQNNLSESSDDEEDDEDDDAKSSLSESSGDEMDEETKQKLAGALGVQESNDGDADSTDESMDDEQMSALDGQLSTIFRERRKQQSQAKELRKENAKARQNVVQLKSRVLDLLDIYLEEQPSNRIGLITVEPLLALIKQTKDSALGNKGRDLVKTRLCRKTKYELEEANVATTLDLLRSVQQTASRSKVKILSLACNQVSVFLSKLLLAYDSRLISEVASIYGDSLQSWSQDASNQILPSMFIDLVNFLDTKRRAQ